jgi:hypothetical protein
MCVACENEERIALCLAIVVIVGRMGRSLVLYFFFFRLSAVRSRIVWAFIADSGCAISSHGRFMIFINPWMSADLSIHGSSPVGGAFSAEVSANLLGRLSVSSSGQFGSDFSAALAARLGNAVSVFTECSFGSSLSFNAFSRLGSAVSVVGLD